MKYYKQGICHIFEANPLDGALVAHTESKLSTVENINHDWFEDNEWNKACGINFSFFNNDRTRNGASYEDYWMGKPQDNDKWIEAIWLNNKLIIDDLTTIDYATKYKGATFIKGVCPLLKDGKIDRSKSQAFSGKAPRTSFGQKEDGTIVMMATDGRPKGLDFEETVSLMLGLGCVNAVMCDGGGSSTMVINNKMVNTNEDRKVVDALLFYSKEEVKMNKFTCIYPTDSRRITSPYGPRTIGDKFHDGIDIGRLKVNGEPIYATHDGRVAMSYFSKSYGNCIIIDDEDTVYSTLYGHMKSRIVKQGQFVKQGDTIGYMGTTGNSTGVHLHFEVRDRHYDSKYWNSHDGEFYSSYDPIKFIVEKEVPELVEQTAKANIEMLLASAKKNTEDAMKNIEDAELLIKEI